MKKITLFIILIYLIFCENAFANSNYLNNENFKKSCLKLSRNVISNFLESKSLKNLDFPEEFNITDYALFVTLENKYKVRGCRGTLYPTYGNLKDEIINNSIGASFRDNRFPPLSKSELKNIKISITIIEELIPLENINNLEFNEGLIAINGSNTGVVLPYEGKEPKIRSKWALKKAGLTEYSNVIWYKLKGVRFKEE